MIHILDLPGQGDPAPGEVTYPDACDLILYRAWQPALEAMQSGREGRDQRDRMGQRRVHVCMHIIVCMYTIACCMYARVLYS